MKNLMLAATCLLLVGFMGSCEDDGGDNNNNNKNAGQKLTCNINGKAWESNGFNEFILVDGDTLWGLESEDYSGFLSLTGIRFSDTSRVHFTVVKTGAVAGTYTGTTDPQVSDYCSYSPKWDYTTSKWMLQNYDINWTVRVTHFYKGEKFSGLLNASHKVMSGASSPYGNIELTGGAFTDVPLVRK